MTKRVRTYLSGGMEYAKGEGVDWRLEMEKWVRTVLGHSVFNPNVESERFLRKKIPDRNLRNLKFSDMGTFVDVVSQIVALDSKEIALRSDYVICYWDRSAQRGAGTKGELSIAHYFGKPVYLVTRMKLQDIPGWVLGCSTRFFRTFAQLQSFLLKEYTVEGRGRRRAWSRLRENRKLMIHLKQISFG